MYYKYGEGSVDSQSACKIEAIMFPETSTIQPIPYTDPPSETEFILPLNQQESLQVSGELLG